MLSRAPTLNGKISCGYACCKVARLLTWRGFRASTLFGTMPRKRSFGFCLRRLPMMATIFFMPCKLYASISTGESM